MFRLEKRWYLLVPHLSDKSVAIFLTNFSKSLLWSFTIFYFVFTLTQEMKGQKIIIEKLGNYSGWFHFVNIKSQKMKSTVPLKCLKCLDAFLTMSISGVLDNSGEEERLGWIHIISAMYRRPAFVARTKHTFYMKKSWEKLRHDEKSWKCL